MAPNFSRMKSPEDMDAGCRPKKWGPLTLLEKIGGDVRPLPRHWLLPPLRLVSVPGYKVFDYAGKGDRYRVFDVPA